MKASFWFEYLESQIDPEAIRRLATMNDENLKFFMAALICQIAGGIELPTKSAMTVLANRLIAQKRTKQEVIRLTGISKTHYYNLKKAQEVGNGTK